MNKNVLITGGSRGIGKACALLFASKGYNVIINYVSDDSKAQEVESYILENYDVEVMTYKCDISNEDTSKKMVDAIINRFGKIDVLINNAGIAIDCLFDNKKTEDFKRILEVNLIGPFILSRLVGNHMLENKNGNIINIASTNGLDSYYEYSLDYDTSKAGLINLTHNLALYYSPYIRVNAIAPGWVNTEMNKELDDDYIKEECEKIYQRRFAEPKEIANVVYFIASDEASYINNEVIRVDGGTNHS